MKKSTKPCPTEDEIRTFDNVPVEVACRFIGTSSPTLYYALQEERAPFGFAVRSEKGGWTYNISPGLLIRYKRGDLPTYKLQEVINLAAEGVERVIDMKMGAVQNVLHVIGGALEA